MIRVLALACVAAMPAVAEDTCPSALDVPSRAAPLMEALRGTGDPAEAQALTNRMFAEFWTVAPDARAQAMLDEGMARRDAYDYAAAAEALDALIAYCPDYAEGHNQRAFVAFLRSNYAQAVTGLERAVEINPEHFAAWAGLGLSLIYAGRNEAGQGALRRALSFNPWLPERGYLTEPFDPVLQGEDI